MYKEIKKETFERFFCHGIENKREVREGILYFSLNKVYDGYGNQMCYEVPNAQIEREMLKKASKCYRQFYKFVTLNDVPNNNQKVNIDACVKKELQEQLQLLRKEKTVLDTKAGIFFARWKEMQLEGINDNWEKIGDNWTEQIYEILEILQEMETKDPTQYQKFLLTAKLARAIDRKDQEEAVRIKKAYDGLKEKQNRDER